MWSIRQRSRARCVVAGSAATLTLAASLVVAAPSAAAPADGAEGAGGAGGADGAPAEVEAELAEGGTATFWVVVDEQATLDAAARRSSWSAQGAAVVGELQRTARASQDSVLEAAQRHGAEATPYWIANAVEVTGDKALLAELSTHEDVASILPARTYDVPEPAPSDDQADAAAESAVEWNVDMVRAPEVWSQYATRGEGVVVASMDTGVDVSHPALRASYRGHRADGTFGHEYHFFDPTGVCETSTTPCDNNGHGTHTTGTIVGNDPRDGEPQTGVAPGARWIAAKGCAGGTCADADLLAAAQWLLAPTDADGENPRPDLRPDIINNSWGGPPYDFFFQESVRAWTAAGIFPVVSTGNDGPWCGTAGMPGGFVESYAVGAVDSDGEVASFSSRGPSQDDEETKPDISAPGVAVNSAVPGGGYGTANGTSMAAPHATGAAALLWSASDELRRDLDATRAILDGTAIDVDDTSCGGTVDDNNVYGEGLLDVLAAMDAAEFGASGIVDGTVTSGAEAPFYDGVQLTFTGGGVERVAAADPDGSYRLRLPAGSYQLTAGAFGHETLVIDDVVVEDDGTVGQDLTLPALPPHAISGEVTDAASGEPLGQAAVSIPGTPIPAQETGADGTFAFPSVPEGEWQVHIEYGGCADPVDRQVTLTADVELTTGLERRSDSYGYSCRLAESDWIDGTEEIDEIEDPYRDGSMELELPFSFPFYGRGYDSLWPNFAQRAMVSFTDPVNVGTYSGDQVPDPAAPNALIQAFNLIDTASGFSADRSYGTVGTAPNRAFVIEWDFYQNLGAGQRAELHDAEIILHEDGRIVLQYRGISPIDPGQNGTFTNVSLESEHGLQGFEYSYLEPALSDGLAIEFSPQPRDVVTGTITDANDGEPVSDARVSFPLPGTDEPGSVYTDADGRYQITLPEGEWDVTAEGADYRTATRTVESAGDLATHEVDFALETGRVSTEQEAIEVELPQGGHVDVPISIENGGELPLEATVREAVRRNEPVAPRLYDPQRGAQVLLARSYNELWRSPHAQQALEELGVDYHTMAFNQPERVFWALDQRAYHYDAILAEDTDQGRGFPSTSLLFEEWVNEDGRLVFQQDGPSRNTLWETLGVDAVDSTFPPEPRQVHWWNPGHPLFQQVEEVPAMTGRVDRDQFGSGPRDLLLEPTSGEAVAGYSEGPEQDMAGIVIGNDGRTIGKGFVDPSPEGTDLDEDGTPDEVELWKNMIDGVLNGYYRDVEWLDAGLKDAQADPADPGAETVTLSAGADGTVTVGIDATQLAVGEHTVYVSLHSDGGANPYVEIPVHVTVTEGPATVTIRDMDTDVPNRQFGDGTTIDEMIKDEAAWPNRGALVRHVGEAARELRQQGVLTARERGALIRAAAQSTV